MKARWRKSHHVDVMVQILINGDDYSSMMRMKVLIKLAKPKPCLKEYPRICGKKANRYRDITSLSKQIKVPYLQTLLARYLNLEDIVHRCQNRMWKSLDMKVELMPLQEYQVELIQRIRCMVKEVLRKILPELKETVCVKQLRSISDDHYWALPWRKPPFIEALFQSDCRDRRYNLALVNILNPVDSGDVDPDKWLSWVEIPPTGPKYDIINIH